MKKAQKQILLLLIIACSTLQCARKFDVLIHGGIIYDGSSEAPYMADIGISDGTIQAIGSDQASQKWSMLLASIFPQVL
jgi:hypothetical protein